MVSDVKAGALISGLHFVRAALVSIMFRCKITLAFKSSLTLTIFFHVLYLCNSIDASVNKT